MQYALESVQYAENIARLLLYKVNGNLFRYIIIRFYSIIGKKNNQSSVSDTDLEIPTLGSTDNAGNSVNLVSGIIRLPSDTDLEIPTLGSTDNAGNSVNLVSGIIRLPSGWDSETNNRFFLY